MAKDEPTPIVQPIQPSSMGHGDPHTHTQASSTARPGTQDALTGRGNSATTTTFSREDVAPAAREQGKQESEYNKAHDEGRMEEAGGQQDFRMTREGKEGEPRPAQPSDHASQPHGSLVEAGTTMAGDASADGGIEKHDQTEHKAKL
ncbi:hypothetical protein JCM5296_000620 [Sporobolomyces johnsonii]